jgi:hypothetical protein
MFQLSKSQIFLRHLYSNLHQLPLLQRGLWAIDLLLLLSKGMYVCSKFNSFKHTTNIILRCNAHYNPTNNKIRLTRIASVTCLHYDLPTVCPIKRLQNMVGQYVLGLRPFSQSKQPVQQYHTTSCSNTLLTHQKHSHWNKTISNVRTAVAALSEPVLNTKLTYAMRYTRALSKQTDCVFLQHSAVPLVLPFNRNTLALTKQRAIHNSATNYSYNNWSSHVTYLFLQFTFYADTSCPSSKSFFVIYSSWIRLLLHHGDPNSSYYKRVTSMKLNESDFHKKYWILTGKFSPS